ncbi:MAG: hypothetical protein K2M56_06320 [Muribaculaceae bacterium]|nr:hypothetical protein [Muribaculaceae bacterium]
MTNLPFKPSRIDFSAIDLNQIQRILRTGDLRSLRPEEQEYFYLMEMVRGFRARQMLPGGKRIVTKAGIIKILKSEPYGLSDWMARRVYADSLNFFYTDDDVRPKAWANYYAEKLEKWADLAASTGNLKDAKAHLTEAAKLRGCYDQQSEEIPSELLEQAPVIIYTSDARSMGAGNADRKEIEAFIDSIPDLPDVARRRVREDAGIDAKDTLRRMFDDAKEFGDEEN